MNRKASVSVVTLFLLLPALASAQDPEPSFNKPNIMILLDSSGSMEYVTGSDQFPQCHPNDPAATGLVGTDADGNSLQRSRWIEVLEVLNGGIPDYTCEEVDRSSSSFKQEYAMPGGGDPPDADYRNPHHRALAGGCVRIAADTGPVNAFDWEPPLSTTFPVDDLTAASSSCTYSYDSNGFINSTVGTLVRFGMATFDPLPDPGIGYESSSPYAPLYSAGSEGAWSYFVGSSPASGRPADCATPQVLEVGIRNAAAPASEGRLIYFGDPDSNDLEDRDRHDRIQDVLSVTRPYGATPLNGALSDIRDFFWEDDSLDPLNAALHLSPKWDPFVECGCRDQYLIIITDGEPNLDMRPSCEAESSSDPGNSLLDGSCPFEDAPVTILEDLYAQPVPEEPVSCNPASPQNKWRIPTFVVGFATGNYDLGAGEKDCANLRTDISDWADVGGPCDTTTNEDLKVCCTLHELAAAGSDGSELPYIAPTGVELRDALSDIVKDLVTQSASATQPVRSPGVGRKDNTMVAFRLLTSYETQTGSSGLWRGNVERLRITCESGAPTEQEKDTVVGDDFSHNVAKNVGSREFLTVIPAESGGIYHMRRSIRPHAPTGQDDGLGRHDTATLATGVGAGFSTQVPDKALEITSGDLAGLCNGDASTGVCRTRVLNWSLGFDDPDGNSRCASIGDAENCSVIGDVMHSTPVIVDRPRSPVEDESYETFVENYGGRMMMAYFSSNDGIFHGFGLSPNAEGGASSQSELVDSDNYNNEHFGFLPPAVLPLLKTQYPSVRLKLLDGTAVVQDVVASEFNSTISDPDLRYPFRLERGIASAADPANGLWRTVLVQSFGEAQSGYFALDITDARKPSEAPDAGPKFLWQITTTDTGQPLFGSGGTPLITTVAIDDGGIPKEVAVAVLPGGLGGPKAGIVDRSDGLLAAGDFSNTHFIDGQTGGPPSGVPRRQISRYDPADAAAASLTIVRLDNGQVLRTFRTAAVGGLAAAAYGDSSTEPYLDSPITGVPAAFPGGTGMVADRIFVGDQDGSLWRVDLSNTDPGFWEMKLFHDSYMHTADTADGGEPIAIAPKLSVNDTGNLVVAYATGAQDLSGDASDVQYVYSLTEAEDGNRFFSRVNWWRRLTSGEHILGPMELQEGVLYFSTYAPGDANVCNPAPSNIWGVDYIEPADAADLSQGGLGRLSVAASSTVQNLQFTPANTLVAGAGTIFGLSVEYVPSCSDPVTDGDLSYLDGNRSKVTNASPSNLQLVFQTASVSSKGNDLKFSTGFEAVTLNPPRVPSTVLSWAAILD